MYSRIQRFIANLLLFCILLQSCGGNEFYLYREQRQEITAQLKQTRFSTQCNQEQENSTRETPPPGKWIEPTRKFCCPEIAARSYSLTASPKEINTPAPDKASAPSAPAANPSSLSRFSSFFSSLFYQKETVSSSIPEPPIKDGKEATARVGDFMQQWKNPKVDRELLKQQGLNLLQQVEAHKKQLKASYRRAEVAFITTDIDPAAWKLYQAQQNTKKQELSEVRNLREQLITTLQPHSKELTASKIRLTEVPADVPKKQEAATTYSSDEDLQQASDETIRSTRAFVEGVGKALQGQAKNLANALLDPLGTVEGFVELLASLPELPEMLADCLEQLMDEEEPAVQAQQLGNLLTEANSITTLLHRFAKTSSFSLPIA